MDGVDAAGVLRCRVAAPAVDGAANRALIRLLAAELGIAPGSVVLEAGAGARVKRIGLPARCAEVLAARYPGLRVRGPAASAPPDGAVDAPGPGGGY